MTTWWASQAWVDGAVRSGVVLTETDGTWTSVETGINRCPAQAQRLSGIVLPGFVNAHSHAFHRVLRSRTHRGRDSFWSWRDQMYAAAAVLDPDGYLRLARAVFAEMLECGYTTVGEFHYLHHARGGTSYDDPNAMSHALVAAAEEAGIRLTLLDTLYLESAPGEQPDATQVRFSDRTAERWAERTAGLVDGPLVKHGLAIHSVRAVPPQEIAVAARVARERHVPLHAHVSEQPRENDQCQEAYGVTPVELLARESALQGNFTAVHATHLSDHDIALLGQHSSHVCVCATTERDLADGIGPMPALRDAGARLCLGSDSHAVIDAFEETRAIELDQRLGSLRRGTFTAEELVSIATSGGASSLGWPEGGLAVGAPADLVEVRLDSIRMAGYDYDDPLSAVVYAASTPDVDTVVVGGRVVVAGGTSVAVEVARELDAVIREMM